MKMTLVTYGEKPFAVPEVRMGRGVPRVVASKVPRHCTVDIDKLLTASEM